MVQQKTAHGGACSINSVAAVTTVVHELAESLGAAVDAKDSHTRQHSEEVALIAHTLALKMELTPTQADIIHVAAHLHDVGKIGVPDEVLAKEGSLTEAEWAMIRRHPLIGAGIVKPVKVLRECGVVDMILHHHERFDGTGYPHGLAGEDIPIGARIIAVADSLSAMLQKRPYRPARTFEQACEEILRCSGSQFDPKVVAVFAGCNEVVMRQIELLMVEAAARARIMEASGAKKLSFTPAA